MADNRKSVNLLPDYLKTDRNSKFLSGTIDPLIQPTQLERIDGFVGSKISPNYSPSRDFYIKEDSKLRTNYSLEPALVFKDKSSKITDVVSFDDIINEIKTQGLETEDFNKIFKSTSYSFDPYIDWDKLVNYTQYYWLYNGPESILIDGTIETPISISTSILGRTKYLMSNGYSLSNGMKILFGPNVTPSLYQGKQYYVEGVGQYIKLIDVKLLEVNELTDIVYNETFDGDTFDSYPFDGDKKLPLTPEYITINRSSKDENPWSRYNRWFHSEIIRISAEINNQPFVLPLNSRAQRPIIEFKPNIQLYNFGKKSIGKIDLLDNTTADPFRTVDGTIGYYIDGILLVKGQKVVFNADEHVDAAGNYDRRKNIYVVNYDLTTDPPTLRLIKETTEVANLDSVAVHTGNQYGGSCWYYKTATDNTDVNRWVYAQQHTQINQAPLFDLFDSEEFSYSDKVHYNTNNNSAFVGCKIFGYEIGSGSNDNILGFPLKYRSVAGVGSYLFKNYFMTDSFTVSVKNQSTVISTSITYFKVSDNSNNDHYVNVWQVPTEHNIPIIEVQTIEESTTTVTVKSLTLDSLSNFSVTAYVNTKLTKVDQQGPNIIFVDKTLNVNDVVTLKINIDQIPNENGFYETPLSLTNNPLNGSISSMTLSELSDHLLSMINQSNTFVGTFPGLSNLRDLTNYSQYGTRLISNSNPIAFAQFFLGKKEHNVVDAIRLAADQYNQFKMNLLRAIAEVDYQLSPSDALDIALKEINNNKDSRTPYYRSDMLGYGDNKIVKTYTVKNNNNIFAIPNSVEFDLSILSFKSVLVYLNGEQLVSGVDYDFDKNDSTVIISTNISTGDIVTISYYPDTKGAFVPSTPSKLGLYPAYPPKIRIDDSYIGNDALVIIGHDGSSFPAYNDYRDDIILEYEKRVYNNIKVKYKPNIFDVTTLSPGKFRNRDYSLSDVNSLLIKEFIKWTGAYNIDATSNTIADEGDPFTWNYKGTFDNITKEPIRGFWRSIYKYLYDTDRPHTHPWEMLGHIDKPTWWDNHYSWTDSIKRTALIAALASGRISEPPSTEINPDYARPTINSYIPVNVLGELLAPIDFLVGMNSYYDRNSEWAFGDQGPAETAWRRSSYWPFALNTAAALLQPCNYTSSMYDTSRTSLNSSDQIMYAGDAYLNLNKLVVEGDVQTAGFGVYVIEKGQLKDLHYLSTLKQDLDYINFNLFHKVGGFVSKDKLQIVIDSIDPTSQSPGAILPPEDYTLLLNVSNPIKSSSISGVIIQKLNGKFVIKGYDKLNPYFNVLVPFKSSSAGALTVGGKSEAFTEWSGVTSSSGVGSVDTNATDTVTSRYYKQGQVVRYNNRYYRVKVGHTVQSTFDITLFYPLPELPMVGGSTVQKFSTFENNVTQISYGTSFSTIQEIYDVLVGYGAYLEKQGFIFDEYNSDLNEVMDWKFTGKEFLYWTTQNWADGNLITLSPFADYLKYSFTDSIVDNISTGKYEYSLLKADGKSFPIDKFRLSREDGVCIISTIDTSEGMFFATLNSVQKEHGMVFNNTTIFNDTIYDIETGYKQKRIKLSGFRTAGWNGDLSSPGFVYDSVDITDWIAYTSYLPGNVVRYNGAYYEADKKIINDATFDFNKWIKLSKKPESKLLPNFDYKINQFEDFYSLDIDNFDTTQQQLAQHLTGYTPRTYLNNIFTNPVTQYKFYQGFIKEKGTKNAIDKVSKAGKFTREGNITFNEEWAFRIGEYGSFRTYNEIEFLLDEGVGLENPYVVKFLDTVPTNQNLLINYKTPSELLITPEEYSPLTTFNTYASTFDDNNIKLTTAGYVRADDITATAYNKNSLLDIANNSSIQEGDTIWLGFLENGGWTVYRYTNQTARIAGVFVSSPAIDITFSTDVNHSISVGDIVSVVNFNRQVDGVHVVTAVPRLDQFTVASELTTIANEELLSNGSLFRFEEVRYNSIEDVIKNKSISNLKEGEKFWIDNGSNGKWQVYERVKNLNSAMVAGIPSSMQHLGQSIYTTDDTDIVIASAPNGTLETYLGFGEIFVYKKNKNTGLIEGKFQYGLNSKYENLVYCDSVYKSTRAEVVLAYASCTIAPLFPNESEILYWMTNGLGNDNVDFLTAVINDRASFPAIAADTDAARAADATDIINTRAEVIAAYQNNPDAQLYPDEASIRYWMVSGLGGGNSIFNWSIQQTELSNPGYIAANHAEREADSNLSIEFGRSIAYDINKGIFFAGAPAAGKIRGPSNVVGTTIFSSGMGNIKEFESEGLVKISVANDQFFKENTVKVLLNPYAINTNTASHARFGHSLYINQVEKENYTTLLVGAPGDNINTYTGKVYAYAINATTSLPTIETHPLGINVNSVVNLTPGSQFGHKISGNTKGTIIAISAPYHDAVSSKGVIQLYDNNLTWFQTLVSPFGNNMAFGDDVTVSPDGSYIAVSSINSKNNKESPGKVAVYTLTSSGQQYKATRPAVIYALAASPLAPLYYGEVTIINWMVQGLDGFEQFYADYRLAHPDEAADWDVQREKDALGVTNTRVEVIAAYQNNPDAMLYPSENSIRYWMMNGLGTPTTGFASVIANNKISDPTRYSQILSERATLLQTSPYLATRIEVIYAFAANLSAPVIPEESMILEWMVSGLDGFDDAIDVYRGAHSVEATQWDADRLADETGTTGFPILSTRAKVVQAYQTNLDAQVYPDEDSIRYWMTYGLGVNNSAFNESVQSTNVARSDIYLANLIERAAEYPQSSKAEVILAYASNLLASLHPSDFEIAYWMIHGLTGFDAAVIADRESNPVNAAKIDVERIIDNKNIKSTRAEVITAFQTNKDAPIYPTEAEIRRWMIAGINSYSYDIFDRAVATDNENFPAQYQYNLIERANGYRYVDYNFVLQQIIDNTKLHSNLKLGAALSISKDNSTLAISALGFNKSALVKFDENFKDGETTFDAGITRFTDAIPDSGVVYIYSNINGYFVQSDVIIDDLKVPSGKFGHSLVVTNDELFIGAPSATTNSRLIQYKKNDLTIQGGLKLLREQPDTVDISTIDRVVLIDSFKEEVVEYLDVIDPLKGKIAGIAEQELKHKSAFDPATYSIGNDISIVDNDTSWIDDHIGELWWDLSTAKYQWYEQGDDLFRKNNWNKLFPGASIDIYEWVKSDLLPSEWAAQADTNDGLTRGISGQPKYPDNTVLSIKQLVNNVTGLYESVYFYWVKNKVTVPTVKNRRISSYQVSSIISDPVANGLKFVEILSPNSVAFANVQPMLIGNRINANIAINTNRSEIPRHTEWLLLAEGDTIGAPPKLLEKKLFDSLLGHDIFGNLVPDINLTSRTRYGTGIRPQQTLFKDRISALRNQIEFANSILINERITGNYKFDYLNNYEEIPDVFYREFDRVVDSIEIRDVIDTSDFLQAELICSVYNGKIISVEIVAPGHGYEVPPIVTIDSSIGKDAVILTTIDNNGQVVDATVSNPGNGYVDAPSLIVRPYTVIVRVDSKYGNKWTKYQLNYSTTPVSWLMVKNQTYDTRLYWNYVDWISSTYNEFKDYNYVIDSLFELETLSKISAGNYVKINNRGDGRYMIIERLPESEFGDFSRYYNYVYIQEGTIQISNAIWNYNNTNVAYDSATLEETLYDQVPDIELSYILLALKENIFIGDLKIYWNKFFFAAVKYALTEQKLLDWAFKTSFINVSNTIGILDQRSVYKLDNEKYFEDYINEVKPYHTNIKTYTSKYEYLEDQPNEGYNLFSTDFDMPSYYNTVTDTFDVVTLENTEMISQQPWKYWAENYTYVVGTIIVAEPGTRYVERPIVTITGGGDYVTVNATAEAYIKNGGVYQIIVTNPGEGYTENPIVSIYGGGPFVTVYARASASLLNFTTRKNIIGMKFNRVGTQSEIGDIRVYDTFICSGKDDKFVLSILADPDKSEINPMLDGRLVLSNDYTIEYYTENVNGVNKKYSRFVFLNYVPRKEQTFKISYNKNVDLYTAVDMIEHYHTSTDSLSSLMYGIEYPNNIIQGLPFEYSAAWATGAPYDNGDSWGGDIISYYASAKLIKNVTTGSNSLWLDNTIDIVPGQLVNIISSSTNLIRNDTVVVSVNTVSNVITISQPYHKVKRVKSTSTSIGSEIVVTTDKPFNGEIVLGDSVILENIPSLEFNNTYFVYDVVDVDKFVVKAKSILSTTATINTFNEASVTVISTPFNINTGSVLLNYIKDTYVKENTISTLSVELLLNYNDIAKIEIFKDNLANPMPKGDPLGSHPNSEYYQLLEDNLGRAYVNFYQMISTSYVLEFKTYGNPKIEFWRTGQGTDGLDSNISGGEWAWHESFGGLGVSLNSASIFTSITDTSIAIDGDSFLNERSSYAPEECVPGHTLDSLGINVYTKDEDSYPMVFSGSFIVNSTTNISAVLNIPLEYAGIFVNYNGTRLTQVTGKALLTDPTKFCMIGNTIYLADQTVLGQAGYTLITIGGTAIIDSNSITVSNATTAFVTSLSNKQDVNMAYCIVDGNEKNILMSSTSITDSIPYRVGVNVTGLDPSIPHTIQAWFFKSKYATFNKVNEEKIIVGIASSTFALSSPPGDIEPVSAQVIVELVDNVGNRKRLDPPWVSYYKISGTQLTFDIDSKNFRPSFTYTADMVSVYANGIELRPGFDYSFDEINNKVTIATGLLKNDDVIAVVGLVDYDYVIKGNILHLSYSVSNTTINVISFTDHDSMLIRTERFDGNINRRFALSLPVFSDNYVWVYVDGVPLTARAEFDIGDDSRTIQIGDLIDVTTTSSIVITTINPPSFGDNILGYRIFNDIFDRTHFKRLSKFYSTTLAKPLRHTDDQIHLTDGNGIIPPNPMTNTPGIVIIDGERIEFSVKEGNVLKELRRSTLGTGPATYSDIGTQVIDQGPRQTIPYSEMTLMQTTSTTATVYVISTVANTVTGAAIILDPNIDAVNQVTVYYGGRQLRKTPLEVHDKFYDEVVSILDPEFSINTATNTLTLNVSDYNGIKTDITIVQRKGHIWTGTESLLTSNVVQAEFIRDKKSMLPNQYYYGGEPALRDQDNNIITDNNLTPLEGY